MNDFLVLEDTSPTIHADLLNGKFVTQKFSHTFLAMAHEQLNAMVKGDG